MPLLENYLALFSKELSKDVHGISPEAMDVLLSYSWPGNVRELQNVLKQTLLRSAGHVIIPDFIPDRVRVPDEDWRRCPAGEPSGTDLRRFVDERLASWFKRPVRRSARIHGTLRGDAGAARVRRQPIEGGSHAGNHSRMLAEQSSSAQSVDRHARAS